MDTQLEGYIGDSVSVTVVYTVADRSHSNQGWVLLQSLITNMSKPPESFVFVRFRGKCVLSDLNIL